MLRKGLDPFHNNWENIPQGHSGYTRVDRSELRNNCVLATRIVTNNIVGIRSSQEVPRKFLGYFRYGENFLILTVTHNLPIGLVRFLLGQWCMKPFSLWLRRSVTLKKFLRKVPNLLVLQARRRLTSYDQGSYSVGAGSCTPSAYSSSDYESGGESELD